MKNIKSIIAIAFLGLSSFAQAQVAIGKSELSKIQPANTVTNPSISLEFYDNADNKKGIVMGTSLNGVTKKLTLIDYLQPYDAKAVLDIANEISKTQQTGKEEHE
jgi:hypothetical protein